MLLKLDKIFNKISNIIGGITMVVIVFMILNVFYDAIARYFFRTGSIALQELEWHSFSVVILLGVCYALNEESHVRVDIIYEKLSVRKKAMINMLGVVFFILPIAVIILVLSVPFAYEAYAIGESSGDPGGLPHRWIVKGLIPLSFLLLIITSIGYFIKYLNIYLGNSKLPEKEDSSFDILNELKKEQQ